MIASNKLVLPNIKQFFIKDLKKNSELNFDFKFKLNHKNNILFNGTSCLFNSFELPPIEDTFGKSKNDSLKNKENILQNKEIKHHNTLVNSYRFNNTKYKLNYSDNSIKLLKKKSRNLTNNSFENIIDYSFIPNIDENDNFNICFHLIKIHYLIEQNLTEFEFQNNFQKIKTLFLTYFNILKKFKGDLFSMFGQEIGNYLDKIYKMQMCLYSKLIFHIYYVESIVKYEKVYKNISLLSYLVYITFLKSKIEYNDILNTIFGNMELDKYEKTCNEKFNSDKISDKNVLINQLMNKTLKKLKKKCKFICNLDTKLIADSISSLLLSINRLNTTFFIKIIIQTIVVSLIPEPSFYKSKLLLNSENSILPSINPKFKYTLVLDLDETLEHAIIHKGKTNILVRPYVFDFLNNLKDKYEIIAFTAGIKEVKLIFLIIFLQYCEKILKIIDYNGDIFQYALSREHISYDCSNNKYKDLSKIGRDLSKTIIIENEKDNFKFQPDNGFLIKSWCYDVYDNQLKDFERILLEFIEYNIEDVRPIINKIHSSLKIGLNNNPYSKICIKNYMNN